MPNGWYPVNGLDVVLINRSEQRYPRLEWDQTWDSLNVSKFNGARGYAPQGPFRFPSPTSKSPYEEIVNNAREVIGVDSVGGTAMASVASIDFKKKTGFACGGFSVYGFQDGVAKVLLDLTLGADVPAEMRAQMEPMHFSLQTSYINADGIQPSSRALESFCFGFDDCDSLVLSSEPLHYDAHWPPKNALDCVAILLAMERHADTLIAIWKREKDPR